MLWVERLGLAELLLLLPAALRAEVRYDERRATPAARRALPAARALGARFVAAGLSLRGTDASGQALCFSLRAELEACLEDFCSRARPRAAPAERRLLKCYLAATLYPRFVFLAMAESAARALPGARHAFYMERDPISALAADWRRRSGADVRLAPFGLGGWRPLLRPLALVARAALPAPRPRASVSRPKPSIWIEYLPGEVDGPFSRAFWKDELKPEGFELVYYLDRGDTPCDARAVADIERGGFRWVDCHSPAAWARLPLAQAAGFAARLVSGGWLARFHVEVELLATLWRQVFERFQVKALVQHQETSWKQYAQARALEAAGGVMVGFNWSQFLFRKEPTHPTPQHVYFAWGKSTLECMEARGTDCRHILPCGAWVGAGAKPYLQPGAWSPAVVFKLALFDSSCGYDMYQTEEHLAEFFSFALELLETNPSWGAVYKPQADGLPVCLPGRDALAGRMDRLRTERRLILAPYGITPIHVAQGVDLGVCFSLNSAGIVFGAHGYRAVHWDFTGFTQLPFYAVPGQQIAFRALGELGAAVRRAAAGDRGVGDFSPWRAWVNHFVDERAAERVAGFLADYMRAILRGEPAERSLAAAATAYHDQHAIAAAAAGSAGCDTFDPHAFLPRSGTGAKSIRRSII